MGIYRHQEATKKVEIVEKEHALTSFAGRAHPERTAPARRGHRPSYYSTPKTPLCGKVLLGSKEALRPVGHMA
jgi:hypothetical protein